MHTRNLTRRDFLKLAALSPLTLLALPTILEDETPRLRTVTHQLPRVRPTGLNVLVVVFDALSARNMSLYGYPRRTTPQIERAAQKAIVYHRHYAGGNFTSPGTASLLTGAYPWSHRAINIGSTVTTTYQTHNIFRLLSPHLTSFAFTDNEYVNTLFNQFRQDINDWTPTYKVNIDSIDDADRFFHNDFQIASKARSLIFWRREAPTSFFLSRFNRLRQFYKQAQLNRQYARLYPRGVPNFTLNYFTVEKAMYWLRTQTAVQPQPHFGYIHLFPPHAPYTTRSEFIDRFADDWKPPEKPMHFSGKLPPEYIHLQRQHYDESVAYVDSEFGRLYDALERSGALRSTLLILTSDHGEMFERGILAHDTLALYEPVIHVPLLIWTPENNQRQDIVTLTSAVDLLPTLLEVSGLPIPAGCEGQILPGVGGQKEAPGRSVFSVEAKRNPKKAPLKISSIALIQDQYKLIRYAGYPDLEERYELYDLQEDSEELHDLFAASPQVVSRLRQELLARLEQASR